MKQVPLDQVSKARLAERGLELRMVESPEELERWLRVEMRAFHEGRRSDAELARMLRDAAYRRTLAVRDPAWPDPEEPVGTICSWVAPLSVPGPLAEPGSRRDIDGWAIGAVSVAPTHRRHGIGRALVEGQLRAARAAGVPLAILTVSEATIYGRYGFAPAARAVDLQVDTRRCGWRGPDPVSEGRGLVRFVSPGDLQRDGRAVFEQARSRVPGQMGLDDVLWAELCHATASPEDVAARPHLRAIRYDDAQGTPRGFALYRAGETPATAGDPAPHGSTVTVLQLCAATDDAYAALWRFLLSLDLVERVTASLRSTDEPLRWLLADERAMQVTAEFDHLWLRLLDIPAALERRGYAAPGRIGFRIADPLGLAPEAIVLTVGADGVGTVSTPAATGLDRQAGLPVVSLGVAELGALYLGATRAHTLARAGRVQERHAGDAARADAVLHTAAAPWLNIGF